MSALKVLAVASECFPLLKTGGLADVVGALPGALHDHGVEVRTLVPGYPAVLSALESPEVVYYFPELFGGPAQILAGRAGGLDIFALEAHHHFNRPGNPYIGPDGKDWFDNPTRFAALSCAAAEIARGVIEGYQPDLVHAHDWQAALTPIYMRYNGANLPSVMTVHNLAFQGQYAASVFPYLGLPPHANSFDGIEYYGGIGFLKGGLNSASAITTVSPSYAEEICTTAFGMGLDGLLRVRHGVLTGIVNGIDTSIWNPATDEALPATYDTRTLARRSVSKRAIEARFGLDEDEGPIFCVISRLTWQKGMDILAESLDTLVASGARLALLGSGDTALQASFLAAAELNPGRIGVVIGYDEALSHLMQAGCDAILVPSRFEPCGLTQLYGLRYGCVPVVARTGGLADTVIDANDAAVSAGVGTGVLFNSADQPALDAAIERTVRLYADKKVWASIQKAGMKTDVSWDRSAARYAALYQSLVKTAQP